MSQSGEDARDAHYTSSIQVGDILSIDVFDNDDLSGNYTVLSDKTIMMPLLGAVSVENKNTSDLSQSIVSLLQKKGLLVQPDVVVSLPSEKVRIMGEIMGAGAYAYANGMTILSLVADAGGFTYRANQKEFDIIRKTMDGTEEKITGTIATRIYAGDIIRVRERYF